MAMIGRLLFRPELQSIFSHVILDIQDTISLLKRSVISLESRFANRALRGTAAYRDLITADILKSAIESNVSGMDFLFPRSSMYKSTCWIS